MVTSMIARARPRGPAITGMAISRPHSSPHHGWYRRGGYLPSVPFEQVVGRTSISAPGGSSLRYDHGPHVS